MTNVRPRKFAHKGRVDAAGFLFNSDLIGVAEVRRRILDLWGSGVQVFADGANHFVRLPETIRVDSAHSVATPLVQIENVLSALPLSADELAMLQAPSHSVVYSKGGVAQLTSLSSAAAQSPENWLDVSAFNVVEVTSLGAAFAEPKVVGEPQPFDARAKLDGAPAETAELREAIAAIKRVASGKQSGDWSAGQQMRGWLGRMIGRISSELASMGRRLQNRSATSQTGSGQGQPAQSGWLARVGLRLLHTSRLAQLLGRRQAKYFGKMMEMFERGDLDEALKHAIPLSDLSSLQHMPALGVPAPRNNLSIRPWQGVSSRTIGLGGDFFAYLNQLYRSTFDRLVAQNRIEEAAFVLAELLRANAEAVAFLERHGKLRLAAELAEARELPPGLVVRQWFIAGDIKRAVEIARRTHAFADAVVRLERKNEDLAEQLRVLWAESMAAGGNYTGAVDVIWSIQTQRPRAREWMDSAIEVGGPVAGRMLARKLTIAPEDFDDIRRRALTFLEDESYEQQETRTSFAQTLCFGEQTRESEALARVTARAILRDAAQYTSAMSAKQFNRLVKLSGDGPLRTDLPPFPVERDQPVGPLLTVTCAAVDRGSVPVHDASLLPNGRMLVALGEVGARLLTRDGRTVAHFDQPAEKFVISDNGARAIALAQRGEVWRLSRLDLIDRRGEDWCDAHIDAFAPDYDGSLWFLGAKGDFYAIDAHAKTFDALWRVPDAGDEVLSVARSEAWCSFLTRSNHSLGLEQWRYALPLLTLRSRTSSPAQPENVICVKRCAAFSPEGVYVDQSAYARMDSPQPESMTLTPLPTISLRVFEGDLQKLEFTVGNDSCEPMVPEIFNGRVVSSVRTKESVTVGVVDLQVKRVMAQLIFSDATEVSTRLSENTITVADNLGRVVVVELRRNCTIRNLRI